MGFERIIFGPSSMFCVRGAQLPAVKAIKMQALTGLKALQAETSWDASKERSVSVACQIVSRL